MFLGSTIYIPVINIYQPADWKLSRAAGKEEMWQEFYSETNFYCFLFLAHTCPQKSTPELFPYNLKFSEKHGMKGFHFPWPVFSDQFFLPMRRVWKSPIYFPEIRHSLIIYWFQNKELFFKELNKHHIEAVPNGINLS